MNMWRRKLRLGAVAAVGVVSLVAAACSSSGSAGGSNSASSGTPVKGGTATVSLAAGVTLNYIFPFYAITNASVYDDNQFQWMMYRPLYMFGNNTNTSVTVNYPLSPADPPIYQNGGRTVVVNMKGWKWSDGETVNAQSLIFFLNMAKAEKTNWYAYSAGLLPDNVVSYKATGPNQVTMQLNKPYSSLWYTYNQLSELNPMPMAWDVTSLGAKPGSGGCTTDTAADGWAHCKAVYSFLSAQAKIASTYATSPLWSVVDGPWKLSSFNTNGNVTIVPNKAYSGSPKPKLSAVKFLPYTADSAEYTALKTGELEHRLHPDPGPGAEAEQLAAAGHQPAGQLVLPGAALLLRYRIRAAELQQPAGGLSGPAVVHPPGHAVRREPARHRQGDLARVRLDRLGAGPDRAVQPVRSRHPEGERRPGPVPVQPVQGQGAADQPWLVGGWRRDDLPGPIQVRQGHHQGRAAQDDVRLLHGHRRRHGDVSDHQVRGGPGRHRRHPGRAVVRHDHR